MGSTDGFSGRSEAEAQADFEHVLLRLETEARIADAVIDVVVIDVEKAVAQVCRSIRRESPLETGTRLPGAKISLYSDF